MNTYSRGEDPKDQTRELGKDLGALNDAEAQEFTDTVAELGASLPAISPPPQLKSSIMDIIARTPQDKPLNQSPKVSAESSVWEGTQDTPNVGITVEASENAPVVSLDEARGRLEHAPRQYSDGRRSSRRKQAVAWLATAAAAAVFFVGGVFAGTQMDRPLAGENPTATATLAPPGPATILGQADAQSAWGEVTGGGTALLVASANMGKSALMLSGVPKPQSGETYQLWYIQNGKATSAGVISLGNGGSQWFELDGTYKPGMTVGVTVEPEGGSEQPTTTPVVGLVA